MIFSNDVKLKSRKNLGSSWICWATESTLKTILSIGFYFQWLYLFSVHLSFYLVIYFQIYFQIERHFFISWSDRLSAFIFIKMSFKPCLSRIFSLYMNFLSTVFFLSFLLLSFFFLIFWTYKGHSIDFWPPLFLMKSQQNFVLCYCVYNKSFFSCGSFSRLIFRLLWGMSGEYI